MSLDISMPRIGLRLAGAALLPASELEALLLELEEIGYRSLWFSEGATSKDALVYASLILDRSSRIVVAPGIANIYVRDAVAMQTGALALAEAHPGRFVLGLGVSHRPLLEQRGHDSLPPLRAMSNYLDTMAAAEYAGARPAQDPPIVLGALRPKMLELARERTAGAHTYFVSVEHTRRARAILGSDRFLAPDQAVVLSSDKSAARVLARQFAHGMLRLPNYRQSLIDLGYPEFEVGGKLATSILDDLVAYGDIDVIVNRVRAHLDAGADHVCVQVLTPHRASVPIEELRELAPALLAL
jgi:probable F420-dependent oxidoreductase